jgi:hypothetical protein
LIKKIKKHAFQHYVNRPKLFFPWFAKQNQSLAYLCANRDTEVVIEGFPRCGNTFAVIAFLEAQQREVKIAHHLHVPAQIRFSARNGIPTLVLIRDPLEAVSSLIVRHPERTPKGCLAGYERFYRSILSLKDKFVVSDFKETVNDFGSVTARLNTMFGTSFECFKHTPENIESVFNKIEKNNQILEGSNIFQLARPAQEKERPKEEVKAVLLSPEFKPLLERGEQVYQQLTDPS